MSWFKDGLIKCTIVQDTIIHKTQQRHIASPQEPTTIKNLPDFPRSMFCPCQGRLKKTVTESICLGGRIPLLGFLKPSLFVFKLKLESWKAGKGGKGEFGCAISLSAKEVLYCNNIFSFLPQVKGMPVATSATINNIQMADKGDLRRLEC